MAKDPELQTISINLPRQLVRRLQTLGFNEGLSASSIVEHSVLAFLSDRSDEQNASKLRELGARLRRT